MSVVIVHNEMGVYLGSCMGLGFWTLLDPAGQARREMLTDLLDGPKTGAMHYPPNKWALQQGYATKRDGKYGAIIFEITPAGRRALDEATHDR